MRDWNSGTAVVPHSLRIIWILVHISLAKKKVLSWYYVLPSRDRRVKVCCKFKWNGSQLSACRTVSFWCRMRPDVKRRWRCAITSVGSVCWGLFPSFFPLRKDPKVRIWGTREEDVWIIVISAEIIGRCSSVVGAENKPASGLGSWQGLLFHSTSANVTMTTEPSERVSLLPLRVYDATGVSPESIPMIVFFFFFF